MQCLKISRGQLNKFRREARRHWPREIMSPMFGEVTSRGCNVFWIGEASVGDRYSVDCDDETWEVAYEAAKDAGSIYIGSIHSHTYKDGSSPSVYDLRTSSEDNFFGICCVWKDKTGKLHTSVEFFPGQPKFRLHIK